MKLDEARELLKDQMDFKVSAHSSLLKETIEGAGHRFIFFPKFHPEFNPIELFWGKAKEFTRNNCDYSFEELQKIVPLALDDIELFTIRKFYNHCWRYMRAYKDGNLTPYQVEWAIKKYSSHRRIKDSNISEMDFISDEFLSDMPQ
jgi:transposase